MTSIQKTLDLTAQCLCREHTITTSLPSSSLPLQATYCHCASCRHLTGGLYARAVVWPGPDEAVRALSLREYAASKDLAVLFCGTCSSPMFWRKSRGKEKRGEGKEWYKVSTGVLSNSLPSGTVHVKDHIFVGDTLDGGAAVWLRKLLKDRSEDPTPCYQEDSGNSELVDPNAMAKMRKTEMKDATAPEEIPLYCHCKGVNLVLRRGVKDFAAMDPSKRPFFVEPSTHKLLAGFDACNSCRISGGNDVVNWTFALLEHVDYATPSSGSSVAGRLFPSNGEGLKAAVTAPNRDPRLGTLALYASSEDVQRYFCARCSACVFYHVDSRPEMVDLSIGLLDAADGARAESVLAWALGWMSWKGEVTGTWREEFAESIIEGSEHWRMENDMPLIWIREAREKSETKNASG